MSLMFLAAIMMAQAPAAVQPDPVQVAAAKKPKRRQICEDIDITGSHVQRHICHDADVNADALFGISNNYNSAKIGAHAGDRGDPNMGPGG